jgi:prefoldin subunit 5
MSLSSAKNYALRAARSQDEKEAIELLSKAIQELAASIEDTDSKVKRLNKSNG